MYQIVTIKKGLQSLFCLLLLLTASKVGVSQTCDTVTRNFSISVPKGCLPKAATFKVIPTPVPTDSVVFYWDLGNDTPQLAGSKTVKLYTVAKKYTIKLYVYSTKSGASNSKPCQVIQKFFNVQSLPTPQFSSITKQLCKPPYLLTLNDITALSGIAVSYRKWYITGPGYSRIDSFPPSQTQDTMTLPGSGNYNVTLQIVDSSGCEKVTQINNYVNIPDPISIDFCADLVEGSVGRDSLYATFNGTAKSGTVTKWVWDFGDGTQDSTTGSSVTKKYIVDSNSTKNIRLIGKNASCSDTVDAKDLITKYYKNLTSNSLREVCRGVAIDFNATNNGLKGKSGVLLSSSVTSTNVKKGNKYQFSFSGVGQSDIKFTFGYASGQCLTNTYTAVKHFNALAPLADFESLDRKGCGPKDTIHLSALNTYPNTTYTWLLYDTAKKTATTPKLLQTVSDIVGSDSFIITKTNMYTVKLAMSTKHASGKVCVDTATKYGYILLVAPKADFKFNSATACSGVKIGLTNLTTPVDTPTNPYTYLWTFQNTDVNKKSVKFIFTGKVPSIIIDSPGVYDVTLEVTNGKGCKDKKTITSAVTVSGVSASISFSMQNGNFCPPATPTSKPPVADLDAVITAYPKKFTNLQYIWFDTPYVNTSFSTNNSKTTPKTSLTIKDPGSYDIRLTIIQDNGTFKCTTVVNKPALINIGTKSDFVSPETACINKAVQLQNTSKYTPDDFAWSVISQPSGSAVKFNNGLATSTDENPTVAFNKPGQYIVQLKVTKQSSAACASAHTDTIIVVAPKADFNSNDRLKVCAPKFANFVASPLKMAKYIWNFGDDTTNYEFSDEKAYHYYTRNNPIGFNVRLIIETTEGCRDTIKKGNYIKIVGPVPRFILSSKGTVACGSSLITITDSSKNITKFTLDYKDGSAIDTVVFTSKLHQYNYSDFNKPQITYYPELISQDSQGTCFSLYRDSIKLNRPPQALFAISNPVTNSAGEVGGCNPFKVTFIDQSKYGDKRVWDADNDGIVDTDTSISPTFTYSVAGTYSVKLISTTKAGCTDDTVLTDKVIVYQTPKAAFTKSANQICPNELVSLYDSGTIGVITDYFWDFGDTQSSTNRFPQHSYVFEGTKTIKLIVKTTNSDGSSCIDSTTGTVVVNSGATPPTPTIDFVTVDTTSSGSNPNGTVKIKWLPYSGTASSFSGYSLYRIPNPTAIYTTAQLTDINYNDQDAIIDPLSNTYSYKIDVMNQCGKKSLPSDSHTTIQLTVVAGTNLGIANNQLTWTPYIGWGSVASYDIYRRDTLSSSYRRIKTVPGTVNSYLDDSLCFKTYKYLVIGVNPIDPTVNSMSNISVSRPPYQFPLPIVVRYATVDKDIAINVKWQKPTALNLTKYILERMRDDEGKFSKVGELNIDTPLFTETKVDVFKHTYSYRVKTIDLCGYVSDYSNIATTVLLNGNITAEEAYSLSWTPYTLFQKDLAGYFIQLKDNNGNWNSVRDLSATTLSDVLDSVFLELDSAACFRVVSVANPTDDVPAIVDSSISNTVCLVRPSRIVTPNAFTPGATKGINDEFKPYNVSVLANARGNDLLQYNFEVYNRWGTRVFTTEDKNKGWDGTFNGTDCPQDVYIYYVKGYGLDRKTLFVKGTVTLLR